MPWIEIFKTGTWTDSSGNVRTWTEEDLDKIVEQYNPEEHEAPVVIGHPKDNAPAYGWVKDLKRDGNVLLAFIDELDEEFKQMVNEGRFKKRSISLYPDLRLRHVGFLGAQPPAVKGLKDVKFEEDTETTVYEFAAPEGSSEAIAEKVREELEKRGWTDIWVKYVFPDSVVVSNFETGKLYRFPYTEKDGKIELGEPEEVVERVVIEPVSNEFAENNKLEEARKKQKERAKKYGIEPKEGGNLTKPSKYENVPDDEFADPVNYRYPIDEAHIKAALSYWAKEKNRKQYTDKEVQIITERILRAAVKHGVEIDPEKWKDLWPGVEKLVKPKKEVNMSEEIKKLKEENEKLKAELARREVLAFVEEKKKEGKILPAWENGIVEFMMHLKAEEEQVIEFGEGEEKKQQSPYEFFKGLVEQMPKQIEFGEKKELSGKEEVTEDMDFAEFGEMDPDALQIHKEAVKIQREKKVSYEEAVREVLKRRNR